MPDFTPIALARSSSVAKLVAAPSGTAWTPSCSSYQDGSGSGNSASVSSPKGNTVVSLALL